MTIGSGIVNNLQVMKPKVLITDYVHDILPDTLIKNGYEVHYDQSVNNDILETIIHLYEGVVINSKILLDKNKQSL